MVEIDVVRGRPLPFNPEDANVKKIVGNSGRPVPEKVNGNHELRNSNQSLASNSSSQLGLNQQSPGYQDDRNQRARAMEQRRFERQDSVGRASVVSAPQLGPSSPGRYVRLSIIRGAKGFGFTIADSQYGQRVKEIIDRQRCRGLQEGDLLVEINGRVVRNIDHSDVVNCLKGCPQNAPSEFVLQRGGNSFLIK